MAREKKKRKIEKEKERKKEKRDGEKKRGCDREMHNIVPTACWDTIKVHFKFTAAN